MNHSYKGVTIMAENIVFLDGARIPFGKFGGALKDFTAVDLGVFAAKEALRRSEVPLEKINHVVFGNALQTTSDTIYLARHIGLKSGVPVPSPALTVNRLCGSGFQAIVEGAYLLSMGEADFTLVGGTESMSQSPHIIRGARWGLPLGQSKMEDHLWESLNDPYCNFTMSLTAENLAEKYSIAREACDQFAYESQKKTKEAQDAGRLKEEIVPVELKSRKGVILFDTDEHPRGDTTLEGLSTLKPYFKKDGTITAGNASGICEGAAALVMTTEKNAKGMNRKPLGRLVSWGISGCPPEIMGIGPVPACKEALKKAGLTIEQIDLIEINEAFAPQYLAVEKELELPRAKVNVNGGAIALGHPLGASGARLTLTILYELRRRNKRYGIASACIGGGQGIAVIVEHL